MTGSGLAGQPSSAVGRMTPQQQRHQRGKQHAEQDGAADPADLQHGDNRQTDQKDEGFRRMKRIQDIMTGSADDHFTIFQSQQGNEQSDPDGDGIFHAVADCADQQFADIQKRKDQEDETGDENHPQRQLPGGIRPGFRADQHRAGRNQRDHHQDILSHAGRQRNRIVGIESHQKTAESRRQASRRQQRVERHVGADAEKTAGKNRRLHTGDVGHRRKSDQSGDDLRPDGGIIFLQPE